MKTNQAASGNGAITSLFHFRRPRRAVAEYLRLDVGGLADSGEHLRWLDRKLKRGDVLSIKVVEADSADKPRERQRPNPAADLRRQKQYVHWMAKQFGWKFQK